MNYQEFLADIKQHMSAHLGGSARLSIQTVTRNNGIRYECLIIMRPQINVSPTIYLNPYYHRYLNGVTMEEIYADILETYRRCLPNQNFDAAFFLDFLQVRPRIIPKIINYERNRVLLDQVPFIRYLDLAIVFQCLVSSLPSEHASILIYNHHLAFWKQTVDELHEAAFLNAPALLPGKITSMADILQDSFNISGEPDSTETNFPMFVLTNPKRINGAVCFLYPDLLKNISGRFHQDIVILPSSIHETILIPTEGTYDLSLFSSMVKEVNETEITDEEQLSDHAYLYTQSNDKIQMI